MGSRCELKFIFFLSYLKFDSNLESFSTIHTRWWGSSLFSLFYVFLFFVAAVAVVAVFFLFVCFFVVSSYLISIEFSINIKKHPILPLDVNSFLLFVFSIVFVFLTFLPHRSHPPTPTTPPYLPAPPPPPPPLHPFLSPFSTSALSFFPSCSSLLPSRSFKTSFLLVCDQGLAVLLLLVLVQLLQEYGRIRLTLVGLLLQHCPVVDIVILMVQCPEQYAVFSSIFIWKLKRRTLVHVWTCLIMIWFEKALCFDSIPSTSQNP